MNNTLNLIGRVVKDIELKETKNGSKFANVTIAIPRNFKNAEGIYETDFIDCRIYNNIAENVNEYVRKGDLIGIRGRLQTEYYKKENGNNEKKLVVIAERVSYLATKKNSEEE